MTLDFIGGVILMAAIVVNISVFTNALSISQAARIGFVAAAGALDGPATVALCGGSLPVAARPRLSAGRPDGGAAAYYCRPSRHLFGTGPGDLACRADRAADRPQRHARVRRPSSCFWRRPAGSAGRFRIRPAGATSLPGWWRSRSPCASPAVRPAGPTILSWNAFGMLDLVAAVTLGTLSSEGFVVQVFSGDPGSAAVQHMPWLLIPTVLVPFYLITHGIIFAQLRQRRAAAVTTQRA